MITTDNDATIPFSLTKSLSQPLDARFLIIKNDGRFLLDEGFDSLPVVPDELNRVFQRAKAETQP
ncbi:hypothetical protein [Iodobacter ciconiae]|uniref:Uncharacterized protein n=1 Tax=Iodobacter ciconiae TaxID=2496266 RepID=A0A3S8ZS88_9NEIS|nr:hypothetical protein [Iodobacter ciconiae]AZN36346.1 hypothetical protein EJO50_07495 [Iodobacter ciconiae]